MGRAPCCDKTNVKKGPWSSEEDAKLKDYIEKYGTGGNWIALPQKIGLKRCGKSCRLRWLNYLRPNIKHGGFSEEEDNIICSLYISIGSRWSIIAAQLPGRTDNDVKNYWNTRLKKKFLGRSKQSSQTNRLSSGSIQLAPKESNSAIETLSNPAIERLQLHMQLQNNLENPNFPAAAYHDYDINPNSMMILPYKLQEKMMQSSLQLENQSSSCNFLMMQNLVSPAATDIPQKVEEYLLYPQLSNIDPPSQYISSSMSTSMMMTNGMESYSMGLINNYINSAESSSTLVPKSDCSWAPFQAQMDDQLILSNKDSMITTTTATEFDCFKDMMFGVKDCSMSWWSANELDTNSASTSNSS